MLFWFVILIKNPFDSKEFDFDFSFNVFCELCCDLVFQCIERLTLILPVSIRLPVTSTARWSPLACIVTSSSTSLSVRR